MQHRDSGKNLFKFFLVSLFILKLPPKSFANERTVDIQLFVNKTNPVVSTTDNQSSYQQDAGFKVLNQETNQFEQIDDSNYRNSNPNYGQCCPYMNYGNFGN